MAVERKCEDCGQPFTGKTKRARFCSDLCRVRANRRPSKVGRAKERAAAKDAKVAAVEHEPVVYDTLEEQLRTSLTDLNALDTISGMAAVRVAQQIDKGRDTGSAVATLSKELSRLVGEAKVEAAPRNLDKADDIAAAVNAKILRLVQ